MAAFVYRAIDPQGREKRGVIDADNARLARQVLRDRRFVALVGRQHGERGQRRKARAGTS